ncbi:MAG: RNA polymerase sporulation sigma factor SigE [Clostridiales bacterium]|nr:RNA polymerase sporulation sigma factor SigE [Clostridiales bacterium]
MLGGFKLVFNLIKKLFVACAANNEIYYINGAETLPSPLPPEEEADIIARLDDEPELRSVLVEHNLRLVVYIAKKFENTGSGIEDLISIGTIGLIKAINTFRPDKNIKLATYASRCIENEILMHIRKTSSQRGELSIDEPLNIDWDGNELLLSDIIGSDEDQVYRNLESDEDRKTIRAAVAELTEREREIITLRFALNGGRELTQKEVADRLGISQSYISRLEKKIIVELKNEIKNKI